MGPVLQVGEGGKSWPKRQKKINCSEQMHKQIKISTCRELGNMLDLQDQVKIQTKGNFSRKKQFMSMLRVSNPPVCRGLKGPLSPGREKRGGTDSDRDSELELDYAQCKYRLSGVWCLVSGVWCLVSGVWFWWKW